MVSVFSRYPLRLQEAICSRLGWTSLRPVQELASHAILDEKNALILAPTAGGKTEASFFPMLAKLVNDEPESVGLIYLAPIKALLNNQDERLRTYTEMVGLSHFVWHGDTKQSRKNAFIKQPNTLLMTTPESLEVMLLSPSVPQARIFKDLRGIIIDEVHAFAGTDRGAHLMSVIERLVRYTKNDVQRIGLSATVGNPEDILINIQGSSKRDSCVINPPKTPNKKDIKIFFNDNQRAIALSACQRVTGKKSLVFCQSRSLAEEIAGRMRFGEVDVFVHHSSVSKEERQEAEERFHKGSNTSIVCTSTLELGIDVGDLDYCLQVDSPSTVSSFLQRLGRTGRRKGSIANSWFYCQEPTTLLQAIAIVELAREGWVESIPKQTRAFAVLVHQILALTLQFGELAKDFAWNLLKDVPDFSGITESEFEIIISHLIDKDYLFLANNKFSMGEATERTFGYKNFMELYAVFTSPILYNVVSHTNHIIGSLEQAFVDKLVEEMSSFLLSGKAWVVDYINHKDKSVRVSPAPRGRKPSWGGFTPQILGFEICQKIKDIITSDSSIPYLDNEANLELAEWRKDLGKLLQQQSRSVIIEENRLTWWSFAGGQINYTIKYGLQLIDPVVFSRIIADNLKITCEGDKIGSKVFFDSLKILASDSFWHNPQNWHNILSQLPQYRLSKFQPLLPAKFELELIGGYLLDVRGTKNFSEKI